MPLPRKALVSLDATPYYHCVSRCVRRAFLCGVDAPSGRNFDHRRQWLEDRLLLLARLFAIDIAAYAIMDNHYHIVLRIDREKALAWSGLEVIARWQSLFSGIALSQALLDGKALGAAEQVALDKWLAIRRERLMNVSWFMRCMNETIARQANAEDAVGGRFWEGRFKSQALLDDQAVIACMAYVDLNPVRANIAKTPEASEHTSIHRRIVTLQAAAGNTLAFQPKELLPFAGGLRESIANGLGFSLKDYMELLDSTGRVIRNDKPGAISVAESPILERLNLVPEHWMYLAQHFQSEFKTMVGCYYTLKAVCVKMGLQRAPGAAACKLRFIRRRGEVPAAN